MLALEDDWYQYVKVIKTHLVVFYAIFFFFLIMVMVYYSERIQNKISQEKKHKGQSPGEFQM